ncbi:MAG TPA: DUF2797 domain-containing protein [Ectothiorhodospiraceae bacterium]|nr:DUF2797 domain-containing protein [Ectothiorhodospiraceae bacterium]
MAMVSGHLHKMKVQLEEPVRYTLLLDEHEQPLNNLVGSKISLHFSGDIHCQACGRKTKKSYSQGFCYPCAQKLAQCDLCIMRPETCHHHKGTCREPQWGLDHCFQPHVVYLSNTSGLKVGITRQEQIPTRWIDQGATQALPMLMVGSRYHSGLLEVLFKEHVADRTDWRKMLKGNNNSMDMLAERERLLAECAEGIVRVGEQFGRDSYRLMDDDVVNIDYPVKSYPEKVKSLNFDKTPEINGTLMGIKGQYLIFENGVLNIRKFGGYEATFSYAD